MTTSSRRHRARPPKGGAGQRWSEGSALVETAFLLPILVVLFAGIAELGRALYSHHALTKATRDAGRFLSRVADPTDASFQALATNYVRTGSFSGTGDVLVGNDASKIGVTFQVTDIDNSAGTYFGGTTLQSVSVQATYAFQSPLLAAFDVIDDGTIPLTAIHVERYIGE